MNRVELLSPAGNFEKMQVAFAFGADAVYLGGKNFSLRSFSGNFTLDEIAEAVDYAHARSKKIYVTINIFPHENDLKDLPDFLKHLDSIKVDGILVADLGIFSLAKKIVPNLKIHISTQANVTNSLSAQMWKNSKRFKKSKPMSISKSKCLFMVRCAYRIPADVTCHRI